MNAQNIYEFEKIKILVCIDTSIGWDISQQISFQHLSDQNLLKMKLSQVRQIDYHILTGASIN